jgi:hypothetical protein
MLRNGAPLNALTADPKAEKAKNEEAGASKNKSQKNLQMKATEEDRRRNSTTFKPPSSGDFQNGADTLGDQLLRQRLDQPDLVQPLCSLLAAFCFLGRRPQPPSTATRPTAGNRRPATLRCGNSRRAPPP